MSRHRQTGNKQRALSRLFFMICLLAVMIIIVLVCNRWIVRLTLNGGASETIEVGDTFRDPGASARGYGSVFRFISSDHLTVDTSGTVDTDNTGSYQIVYTASWNGTSVKKTRTVNVVDTEPPTISLRSIPDYYTLYGHEYKEEGYTANDNYDGDLTDKVKSEEKEGVVYYTVTDSSGNVGRAERKIVYDDRTAPELVLTGGDTAIEQDSAFTDEYTATDDADGDVTKNVHVDGAVDTSKPGRYKLHYTVSDSHGNKTEADRIVTVWEKSPDRVVYLTFDDGPGKYTQQLLDILAKYNAHATFFVTNQFPDYQGLIAQEAAAGHAIGVHTYSHDYASIYTNTDAYWNDFSRMEDVIRAQTGSTTNLMRFPGGSSNAVSRKYSSGIMTALVSQANEKGYTYFDWNVESGDAEGNPQTETIAQKIIQGIQSRRTPVILCHDIHPETVQAMETVLQWGTQNGYTFAALNANSYPAHHSVNN
ncbi:MAG: immunoglobulin-like domain-containing protein [Bilifractor sp.]|jgi:peptidoglycan/xylan/chitin deacetylase (PgdA/CDA1 family)